MTSKPRMAVTDADDKPWSNSVDAAWEARMAELWRASDDHDAESLVAKVEAAAAELPPGHPIALFERACAQDSTGHSDRAVPLYRAALDAGLAGLRRRRAVIQMASSLRNLGKARASADLLTSELDAAGDELDGAVRAFLALALVDLGREREAVTHSLLALAKYLPRYNRSLARYATEISAKEP
jgi:Tetratrico peptide repeat